MNLLLFRREERLGDGRIRLRDRRLQHLQEVLASCEGDTLRVGEIGGMMGLGRIETLTKQEALLAIDLNEPPPEKLALTLVLALPRPKMLRRILRTAAELGVPQLHLINSYRVQKSYWQTPALAADTVQEYFIQGLEQSRDTILPELHLHKGFKPFVEDKLTGLLREHRGLVAHPGDYPPCPGPDGKQRTLIAIGPEGGFIPYEIEKLQEAGCTTVSLGPRILRVENAVTRLLSLLS